MVFIPIAAIVILIWLVIHFCLSVNETKNNMAFEADADRTKIVRAVAVDEDLERRVSQTMTFEEAERVLHTYLGRSPDWDFFVSRLSSMKECGMLASLAQQRKIPSQFADGLGARIRVIYETPESDKKRWQSLLEEFLLKLESTLNAVGVNAVMLFQQTQPETGPWKELRAYRSQHDGGFTDASTLYRFSYR